MNTNMNINRILMCGIDKGEGDRKLGKGESKIGV